MLFRLGSEAGAFSDKDRLVGDLDGNVGVGVDVDVGVHEGECGLSVDKQTNLTYLVSIFSKCQHLPCPHLCS